MSVLAGAFACDLCSSSLSASELWSTRSWQIWALEKKWTFDQITVLFVLFIVVAEVANIILAHVDTRAESKKANVAGMTTTCQPEVSAEVPVGESIITQPATAVTRNRK